jgi:hypothetical protein
VVISIRKISLTRVDFWEASGSAQTIVDAMKELSRRVIERKGNKIVFKLSKSTTLFRRLESC